MALNTFSNGLRLVCTQKPDKKIACVVLHIAGGTQSEKNYQSGISDYLTKIMLMGTKQHPNKEMLESYAKKYGIILTPHNSKESITISALCPRENVEKAIEILSEIAFDTTFSLDIGDKIRNIQLSQVAMLSDSPAYVMSRLINSTLYPRTGLSNPKPGTNISVSRFRAIDAKDFLEKVFTPRNTIISVVGDVNQDEVYDYAKVYFFDRMKENESEYKKLKYVSEVDDFRGSCKGRVKRLNQTRIGIAFPTVSFKEKEKYLIEIVKPILLKNLSIALSNKTYYNETKIKTKYYANNGNIVFEIMVDFEEAKQHIFDFVKALNSDVKKCEIGAEEFEAEKRVFVTNFINTCDNVLENALLSAKNVALTKQSFSESTERLKIEMLSHKDATKLLRNIIDFKKMVVVYLGHDISIDFDDIVNQID